MIGLADKEQARHLSRFFKSGPGEYGYGDKFLGIKVPVTRGIVREFRKAVEIEDCVCLIHSEWHEIRLAGFLLLIEIYNRTKKSNDKTAQDAIVQTYLTLIGLGNNWDLVDLVAPKILGDWLIGKPQERKILYSLADREDSLWHQRVAIVSTWSLLREGIFEDTIQLSVKFLCHPHDLIHKATGWMLREMGKRGGYDELIRFLDQYAASMPRTALRYAIERFDENLRRHYMQMRQSMV